MLPWTHPHAIAIRFALDFVHGVDFFTDQYRHPFFLSPSKGRLLGESWIVYRGVESYIPWRYGLGSLTDLKFNGIPELLGTNVSPLTAPILVRDRLKVWYIPKLVYSAQEISTIDAIREARFNIGTANQLSVICIKEPTELEELACLMNQTQAQTR